ncbi:hypothetical protein AVEN_51211-1 [Araneus ventricosus]|uniref:Endonuclease/exonuclease/phosphatase domain-containing protein n=1 Tax=Araneus ventricosus TaxID=182803 RepID=A0A4Y2JG65_ARAVE|nr:hypothetical protein AVEN_51211-1 [Araneus ventricosus]
MAFMVKINDLRELLSRNKPDIVLLQETHFSGIDKLYFPNYIFYTTLSRTLFRRRGTGIIIKKGIPHHDIPNTRLHYIEATMAVVEFKSIAPIHFMSVYNPPQNSPMFKAVFAGKTGQRPPSHEQPTRYDNRGTPTITDLAITRNINFTCTAKAVDELSSDHQSVKFLIDTSMTTYVNKVFIPHSKNFQNATVNNKTRPFDPRSSEDIENEVKNFTIEHQKALEKTGKWSNKTGEEFFEEIREQTQLRNRL